MAAVVPSKMRLIVWRQKCALVVVEPPCEFVGCGILEIDDDVLARAELIFADVLAGFVRQALVLDLCIRVDMRPVKARKHRCRRNAVETIVVV